MDSKNIIIIVLVALIIAGVGVLCFSVFNTGTESVVVNNTTVVNDTNDTVNATLTSSSNSNSGHTSSSSSGVRCPNCGSTNLDANQDHCYNCGYNWPSPTRIQSQEEGGVEDPPEIY